MKKAQGIELVLLAMVVFSIMAGCAVKCVELLKTQCCDQPHAMKGTEYGYNNGEGRLAQ